MSGPPVLAGVDVGGGGVRVLVRHGGSTSRAEDEAAVPRTGGGIDVPALVPRVVALLRSAASSTGSEGFDRVAVGLTGLPDLVDDPGELVRALRSGLPAGDVTVAADALTTHTGALGGRAGVVVAAGTGAVALGTDLRENWRRTDGWGHLLGDRGSGAWIGRQGLQHALRALDGLSDGSPELLAHSQEHFGGVGELEAQVYRGRVAASSLLAGFAPRVAEAAHAGDPVAQRIWWEAGTRLGETAVAAAAPGSEPRFSWGGRLFEAGALLAEPFRAEVLRHLPDACLQEPAGDSVDGALALAESGPELVHRPPYLYRHG
ncbi:N-acetylglucosamine kinase [Nocardiopsis kunsanensis]|uniref:ATPase BadF/BadG/BcrA/BcrD type domain-containing protein n=1 Tax=Nocardiopsis kunsanensis TaxID=141693 RepID=A0A918XFN7_9ACTN|nr:BadF/BadG/BcrA/BcrD ATPase family protein [Nocardiopsis kunsanensis]GHD29895.1 hypothetical protein GCM10007147_31220 [Nocardiopsis kunsanensis]